MLSGRKAEQSAKPALSRRVPPAEWILPPATRRVEVLQRFREYADRVGGVTTRIA